MKVKVVPVQETDDPVEAELNQGDPVRDKVVQVQAMDVRDIVVLSPAVQVKEKAVLAWDEVGVEEARRDEDQKGVAVDNWAFLFD